MTTETKETKAKKATLKFAYISISPSGMTETRSPQADTTAMHISRTDNGEIVLRVTPDDIKKVMHEAAWHGVKQSLNDASTGKGAEATLDERIELLQDRFDTLFGDSPAWTAERESSGPRTGDVIQALANLRGYTLEEAKAKWLALSEEQQKTLRNHDSVKVEVAAIRLARAKAKENTSPALDF